jgi:hypothetical protein
VLRVQLPAPWLLHIELQSGQDASLGQRLLRYNVLLTTRHDLPTREGQAEEARRILLRLGRKSLGKPPAATLVELEAIQEVERLEALTERLLEASSWSELLAASPRPRPNGKKRKSR